MPDRVALRGLRARGHHGVFDFERREGQDFVVDAVLYLDTAPAAASDDVGDTVHYGLLADRLVAIVTGEPVNLIETLAERLARECLAEPLVERAEVTVHKPSAPIEHEFADVAVTVVRARRDPSTRRAVLSLGSNLGDRMASLQGAVDTLLGGAGAPVPVAVSPVYETAPVGGPEQGAFLNAVLVVDADGPPRALLERAQAAERAFDRVREVRWGPRTLDVDVIAFGDVRDDDPELTLPHPRAHQRGFVLRPWLDADPGARLPGRGAVADLLDACGEQGLHRRDDLRLRLPGRG
ncbi:2-amino-4-hydroxy-6-hydroxymethyldihydropteridine diphosphokinase [Nocardiopsis dassonvillei subsp. albirubida]|uniref:Bifunctional folate synthesis protein n=1 Tax=Nocardiopsis alborubida TaxID=146802 RepID=A0A7X6MGP9_9ACTN|nr:2-amino-4-hydroxy-6-hydroxymethyldihydropteridine diphosphokinase [Nocardiopsis alborubida]